MPARYIKGKKNWNLQLRGFFDILFIESWKEIRNIWVIFIKSQIKDGFGRISIRDQGIGMHEDDKKRIFDRFYRVDDSRTKSTGGTGLGLAIVKRIVEIHEGKIEIESEYEVGTEITVVLSAIGNRKEEAEEKKLKENTGLKLSKKIIGIKK